MTLHNHTLLIGAIAASIAYSCGGASVQNQQPPAKPVAFEQSSPGPNKIVLVDKTMTFQTREEPWLVSKTFEFDLAARPRRARLVLQYSGVPGALSEDYKMGRFRDRVELNNSFLMDLNTFSNGEEQVVDYTKWISVGMLKRHNRLTFTAGDNGDANNPVRDEFELRSAVLEILAE